MWVTDLSRDGLVPSGDFPSLKGAHNLKFRFASSTKRMCVNSLWFPSLVKYDDIELEIHRNTSGEPLCPFSRSMPISTALQIARFCSSARQAYVCGVTKKNTQVSFQTSKATFWKTQQVALKFSIQGFFLGGVDQSIILSQNYTIYGGCNCSFLFNIFVRNLSPIFEETKKTIESTAILEGLVWTVRRKWSMGDWHVFMPTLFYIYIYTHT